MDVLTEERVACGLGGIGDSLVPVMSHKAREWCAQLRRRDFASCELLDNPACLGIRIGDLQWVNPCVELLVSDEPTFRDTNAPISKSCWFPDVVIVAPNPDHGREVIRIQFVEPAVSLPRFVQDFSGIFGIEVQVLIYERVTEFLKMRSE